MNIIYMNKHLIISLLNSVSIMILFNFLKNNFLKKQILSDDDLKKNNNKQLLIIFILCCLGTYISFYVIDNKLLDKVSNDNMEIKVGDPNF